MKQLSIIRTLAIAASLLLVVVSVSEGAAISVSYAYNLADFSGAIPYMWAKLATDPTYSEVYVMDPKTKDIRIFNETGMEVFRFGEEGEFAWARDLTADEEGNIYLLNLRPEGFSITQCNFRGEPVSEIRVEGMPEEFAGIRPTLMEYSGGKLYLADTSRLAIVVTDVEGRFDRIYDVKKMIAESEDEFRAKKKGEKAAAESPTEVNDISGFGVDSSGNMYFTISTLFAAFRLSPEGKLRSYGKSGSTPGSFGIAAGIDADDMGNIYVADRLRCAVIVFDRNFKLVTEFGFRGYRPGNLIVPDEVAVARDGRLFVSQSANRGVSVYSISRK